MSLSVRKRLPFSGSLFLTENAISFDKVTNTSLVCFNPFKGFF